MVKALKRKVVDLIVRIFLLTAVLNGLSACTTTKGSFCDIAKPLRPSKATIETLTDEEAGAVLAHNLKGKRLCGWTPK